MNTVLKLKHCLVLFAVLLMIGCGGGGGDSSSSGGDGDSSRIKWSYNVGSDTYIYYSSAALSEDEQTIYFGTSKKVRSDPSGNDALIALNNDGTLKWKYSLSGGEEVRSSPVVSDGIVCFIADYRTGEFSKDYTDLVCLNESDGSFRFQNQISGNTTMSSTGLSKAIIKNNKVFAFMECIYAFDETTGEELFKSNQFQTSDNYVNPIVIGDEIFFILANTLYFVSADDYTIRTIDISTIMTTSVLSTPAVDSDNNIYFGTESGKVIAIDIDGNLLWEKEFNPSASSEGPYIRSSTAIDEGNGLLYVGTKNNSSSKFLALSISTGDVQWEYETGGDVYSSPTIGDNGRIYVGSESRYLYAFDPDGSVAWKVGVSQDITWPSPTIDSQGVVYIGGMGDGSGSGKLHAIQTDSSGLMSGVWSKIHKNNQNTAQ